MSFRDDVKQLVITEINRNPTFSVTDGNDTGMTLIRDVAGSLAPLYSGATTSDIDVDQVWREIQAECYIWVDDGRAHLHTWHRDWLTSRLGTTEWYFWNSYRRFLESSSLLPPRAIQNMDGLTNEVLKELGDPRGTGDWDRRGMVVGEVQAGKTANYTGLINKALDAGYKVVIVLAGTQDDLRSQTQKRLDRGVIGGDTRQRPDGAVGWAKIGVGKYRTGPAKHTVIPLTDARMHGDFSTMKFTGMELGGESPLLLVIKKNASILKRVHGWIQSYAQERNGGLLGILPDVPLLLIDDEADSASINVHRNDDEDPTVINGCIRQILNDFGQKSYVGYTATPFANIFIQPDDVERPAAKFGPDLFPRDFIFNLPTPSNYIGPGELFGLTDPLHEDQARPGLSLIHYVDDYGGSFPTKHKKDLRVRSLPGSLRQAIKAFILVGAARRARGQVCSHNSMLVHVTRFVDVQKQVSELIQDELVAVQRTLEFRTGEPYAALTHELQTLWEQDMSTQRDAVFTATKDAMVIPVTWEQVSRELYLAASKIEVKTVNGAAKDALDYEDYNDVGLSVIAVGGDKLSRGLTLEGLSVSYYLRATTMYDTLLQMGRWFGYKDGFLDLCRLYTTLDIAGYYQWIALANLELREEFDLMVQNQRTPADYGLRVRQHPTVLQVTSAGKMRYAKKMFVSYSGVLLQTFCFEKNATIQENNFAAVKSWIGELPQGEQTERGITWTSLPCQRVVDLLQHFSVYPRCYKMDPKSVSDYLVRQRKQGELTLWTVCMMSVQSDEAMRFSIGNKYSALWTAIRTDVGNSEAHEYLLSNQQMISPRDEFMDLSPQDMNRALQDTKRAWENQGRHGKEPKVPGSSFARAYRDMNHGLLLIYPLRPAGAKAADGWEDNRCSSTPVIGLAISLPYSASATPVQYVGNETWWKLRYEEESSDDE